MRRLIHSLALILTLSSLLVIVAQEQKPEEPANTAPMGFGARMKTAKTVFLRDGGGNPIAFNVISSAFEGWGRYLPVNKPEDADLIVEVSGPRESGSGISVSSSTTPSGLSGSHNEGKTTTSKEFSNGPIKMVVYDGKSKAAMWSATEKSKSGMRKKTQQDNMVETAERLFTMFHDRIEPPPPPVK